MLFFLRFYDTLSKEHECVGYIIFINFKKIFISIKMIRQTSKHKVKTIIEKAPLNAISDMTSRTEWRVSGLPSRHQCFSS